MNKKIVLGYIRDMNGQMYLNKKELLLYLYRCSSADMTLEETIRTLEGTKD